MGTQTVMSLAEILPWQVVGKPTGCVALSSESSAFVPYFLENVEYLK